MKTKCAMNVLFFGLCVLVTLPMTQAHAVASGDVETLCSILRETARVTFLQRSFFKEMTSAQEALKKGAPQVVAYLEHFRPGAQVPAGAAPKIRRALELRNTYIEQWNRSPKAVKEALESQNPEPLLARLRGLDIPIYRGLQAMRVELTDALLIPELRIPSAIGSHLDHFTRISVTPDGSNVRFFVGGKTYHYGGGAKNPEIYATIEIGSGKILDSGFKDVPRDVVDFAYYLLNKAYEPSVVNQCRKFWAPSPKAPSKQPHQTCSKNVKKAAPHTVEPCESLVENAEELPSVAPAIEQD